MDVDVTDFFSEDETASRSDDFVIVKKKDRLKVGSNSRLKGAPHKAPYGYTYEAMAARLPGKNMEPYLITISDIIPKDAFQHDGEEFIFILSGKMEFIYDGKSYFLEEGDSAYYRSGVPHSGRSAGGKKAKFLCIMYSYKRI